MLNHKAKFFGSSRSQLKPMEMLNHKFKSLGKLDNKAEQSRIGRL